MIPRGILRGFWDAGNKQLSHLLYAVYFLYRVTSERAHCLSRHGDRRRERNRIIRQAGASGQEIFGKGPHDDHAG